MPERDEASIRSSILQAIRKQLDAMETEGTAELQKARDLYSKNTPGDSYSKNTALMDRIVTQVLPEV